MIRFLGSGILLADRLQSLARELGSGFQGRRSTFDTRQLVIILAALASVVAVVWVVSWKLSPPGRRLRCNQPRALFGALCRAHGLDRTSRRLLAQLARRHGMADRARLFLEPERFAPGALGPLRARAAEVRRLRDKLFAGLDAASE
jgi:hypothetical protein